MSKYYNCFYGYATYNGFYFKPENVYLNRPRLIINSYIKKIKELLITNPIGVYELKFDIEIKDE